MLCQNYRAFEFIVVDDGSGPETQRILASLRDPRLRIIQQENHGLSAARNRGIAAATGEYVCFLDSDDTRPAWAFETLQRIIDTHAPDLILSAGFQRNARGATGPFRDDRQTLIDLGKDVFGPNDPMRAEFYGLGTQVANKVVRRQLLKRIRFPDGLFYEDMLFHTSVVAAAGAIATCTTPTFCYHGHFSRPRITTTAPERRFDALSCSERTLAEFARSGDFANATARVSVVTAVHGLLTRCAMRLPAELRARFHHAEAEVWAKAHPGYADAMTLVGVASGALRAAE